MLFTPRRLSLALCAWLTIASGCALTLEPITRRASPDVVAADGGVRDDVTSGTDAQAGEAGRSDVTPVDDNGPALDVVPVRDVVIGGDGGMRDVLVGADVLGRDVRAICDTPLYTCETPSASWTCADYLIAIGRAYVAAKMAPCCDDSDCTQFVSADPCCPSTDLVVPSSAATCVETLTTRAAGISGGCPLACTDVLCRTPLVARCVAGSCVSGG